MQISSHVPQARQGQRDHLPALGQPISRRKFTRYSLFGLLGAFLATSAVATYRMLYPTKVVGFGTVVQAGTVQDIKTQLASQKFVRNDEGRFYILPATDTNAIAVYWRCVHLGCTVPPPSPGLEGNIQCPCHGSLYDGKTGNLIHGPATQPLDYFKIKIDGGNVSVDTSLVIPRREYNVDQTTAL